MKLSQDVASFRLKVIHDLPVDNWKKWYAEASINGKYFELFRI